MVIQYLPELPVYSQDGVVVVAPSFTGSQHGFLSTDCWLLVSRRVTVQYYETNNGRACLQGAWGTVCIQSEFLAYGSRVSEVRLYAPCCPQFWPCLKFSLVNCRTWAKSLCKFYATLHCPCVDVYVIYRPLYMMTQQLHKQAICTNELSLSFLTFFSWVLWYRITEVNWVFFDILLSWPTDVHFSTALDSWAPFTWSRVAETTNLLPKFICENVRVKVDLAWLFITLIE